jgi:arylsulfatase A-like enzyme
VKCKEVDQGAAALITDLKQRGLLDDTIVMWGGEFGRTAYSQGEIKPASFGRDHHPRCYTMWMTGGGLRRGLIYGETDDFGYNIVRDPVHVHDLHATLLHLLGVDHKKLIYRHEGRDYRLTDVSGQLIPGLIS